MGEKTPPAGGIKRAHYTVKVIPDATTVGMACISPGVLFNQTAGNIGRKGAFSAENILIALVCSMLRVLIGTTKKRTTEIHNRRFSSIIAHIKANIIINSIDRRYFQRANYIPIVGVGKRGPYELVHGDTKAAPVTEMALRFTGPVPVDSRLNCL